MVASALTFHVPPDASPEQVLLLVECLAERQELRFTSSRELLEFAEAWDIDRRSEISTFATVLGLLEKDAAGVGISERGTILARLKSQVRFDVAHFLLYAGWSAGRPEVNVPIWSYRSISDYYWIHSPLDILASVTTLVEEVINKSEEVFAGAPGYSPGAVSFSDKSIRGVRKWLEVLRPPVIEGNVFTRRHFCPPELLLLALGYVARQTGGQLDIDMRLTPERRTMICQVCLLEPTALDRALDWMLPLYPEVVEPGTRTGAYGRFVRLRKVPELSDLAT